MMNANPAEELALLERALRQIILEKMPNSKWVDSLGGNTEEKLKSIREKIAEDQRRRKGIKQSPREIDYIEFYSLKSIITKNWPTMGDVFGEKKRFDQLLGAVEGVRNSIAHSREIVQYEAALIQGVSGLIRNQVAEYMSNSQGDTKNYPVIERLRDQFGREAYVDYEQYQEEEVVRLQCGDVVKFIGTAALARGKDVHWYILNSGTWGSNYGKSWVKVASGENVEYSLKFDEDFVGENIRVDLRIVSESIYHRHPGNWHEDSAFSNGHDDRRYFYFSVDPPADE